MTMFISSCRDEEPYTVSGDGTLSPLYFSANLSEGVVHTRANDIESKFESGDKLLAYLEHVDGLYNLVPVDMSPSLVTLDVNPSPEHTAITNGYETSSLTVSSVKRGSNQLLPSGQTMLYWDDFSSSSNDINTTGHGIRVKYGYCYNGRVLDPEPVLNESGSLSWSVIQDQRTAEKADFKKSDLLWCETRESVPYHHAIGDRLGLKIPYTHAMSKVTLVLIAKEGFASTAFASTSATLLNMFISGTMSATDATVSSPASGTGENEGKVFMYKNTPSTTNVGGKDLPCCIFEALVMPTKTLTNGLVIAAIADVEGNNYNIGITDNILKGFNKSIDPSKQDDTTPVVMKSGVNYKLTITLDKQPQNIVAQITDWENVEAEGTGTIQFAADVKTHNITDDDVRGSFELWRSTASSPTHTSYDEDATVDGVNKATTVTYAGGKWTNSPEIYWEGGTTDYYFRALSRFVEVEEQKQIIASGVVAPETDPFKVKQGVDHLWGTTSAHTGREADGTEHNYSEGQAINPRTGTVPMTFYHAMSKITVKLETSSDDSPAHVDLAGAKISIASLYDGGTIELQNGTIGNLTSTSNMTDIPIKDFLAAGDNSGATGTKLSEYLVVPQSLVDMNNGNPSAEPAVPATPRTGTVSFYNISELAKAEDGNYYVKTSLDKEYYTESEVICQNADLPGSISTNTIKTAAVLYTTETEVAAHNATLQGAVHVGDKLNYTSDQFILLKCSEISQSLFEVFHFDISYDDFIKKNDTPFSEFSNEDFVTIQTIIDNNNCTHDAISARAYNAKLSGAVRIGDVMIPAVYYDAEEVLVYNSQLPGAIHFDDVKSYKTKDGSILANPGDLKVNESYPKVMMLIRLADGTTYTLDLATCTTTVDDQTKTVDKWEQRKHYIYTITVKKEKITFRAMIKDWVETQGSGNATLDWD